MAKSVVFGRVGRTFLSTFSSARGTQWFPDRDRQRNRNLWKARAGYRMVPFERAPAIGGMRVVPRIADGRRNGTRRFRLTFFQGWRMRVLHGHAVRASHALFRSVGSPAPRPGGRRSRKLGAYVDAMPASSVSAMAAKTCSRSARSTVPHLEGVWNVPEWEHGLRSTLRSTDSPVLARVVGVPRSRSVPLGTPAVPFHSPFQLFIAVAPLPSGP
jgi:hypothetical protein